MSECPICYSPIPLEDEAYVGSCYHRFCHACIREWTSQQRRHPTRGVAEYACPMCKQAYDYILYDCVLNSYRIEYVDEEAKRRSGGRGPAGATGSGLPLSAAVRRRRALYIKAAIPHEQQEDEQQQQAGQLQESQRGQAHAGPDSLRRPAAPPPLRRVPDDPELQAFVKRELQAVLLQEDVGLVQQHVLGVLRGMLGSNGSGAGGPAFQSRNRYVPQPKRPRPAPATLPPSQQEIEATMSRETACFLQTHSGEFAKQLYLFLASGLGVVAYDALVFGSEAGLLAGNGAQGAGREDGAGVAGGGEAGGSGRGGAGAVHDVVDLVDDTEDGDDFDYEDED